MIKKILKYLGIFILIIIGLMFLNVFILEGGYHIKNINYVYDIQKDIRNNNLTVPFPNYIPIPNVNLEFERLTELFALNITEFHFEVIKNYYYEKDTYDCRYWAFVWASYWNNNLKYQDYGIKFIDTKDHVFIMLYNDNEYCIADGDKLMCYDLI